MTVGPAEGDAHPGATRPLGAQDSSRGFQSPIRRQPPNAPEARRPSSPAQSTTATSIRSKTSDSVRSEPTGAAAGASIRPPSVAISSHLRETIISSGWSWKGMDRHNPRPVRRDRPVLRRHQRPVHASRPVLSDKQRSKHVHRPVLFHKARPVPCRSPVL